MFDDASPIHLERRRSPLELRIAQAIGTRFNPRTNQSALLALIRAAILTAAQS